VDRPLFTRVRWREGYDIAEVDTFLEQAESLLRGT
jgi:DivIVA domain-containing protein